MSAEFKRFSSIEDFKAVSDQSLFLVNDRIASFEERAAAFNDAVDAGRAAERAAKHLPVRIRVDLAKELALLQSRITSALKHFLPETIDGKPNPHHLSVSEESHMQMMFRMAVGFDLGRSHLIKACLELRLLEVVSPELLTAASREPKVDGETLDEKLVRLNARVQAAKIMNILTRLKQLTHYEPDERIVAMVHDPDLRPILLDDAMTPNDFVDMARTMPLNELSRGMDADW